MNQLIIATLVGAVCLLLAPMAALARGNGMTGFTETLTVTSSQGRVLVNVLLDNRSGQTVYVPRAIASEKQLLGRLLEIRDTVTGEPADYQGRMVKRGALTADDYLTLKPKATRRNTIDITDSYAFKQGTHTYQLRYDGYYLKDLKELAQGVAAQTPVAVPPATFTHSGE
ncbi:MULTISPECIES: hypothetical protein [unclassified Janthinobacterium]|uniref:hypothetical protein n=1 Tax=unclassified Janthinobacterium TaxID=2610881 RepID=UPI00034C35CA|nr:MULTISPECIES: hypothetical protein [unclassified Janthinobacterium]MEC5161050.1 hypothetical protein [Janthinobacterium sp. CG_S6]